MRTGLNNYLKNSCLEIPNAEYCEINDVFDKESYKTILKEKVNKVSEYDLDLNHYERDAYIIIYRHITESILL